jgi:hypothetical protein
LLKPPNQFISGFWSRVDSSVGANVSEKHTVSIFRAEAAMLESGGIYTGLEKGKAEGRILPFPNIANSALKMETICFSETVASTDESTRRQNPEDHHHHHPHRRENLKCLNNNFHNAFFF